jgi:O-antigen/teichoic acid export membrane protein
MGPQLPKLVSFFMLPILTKYLTPEDYGINGIILAYVGAFDALKDLGLSVILNNSFFKYPNRYTFTWQRVHGFVQVWAPFYGLLLIPLIIVVTPDVAIKDVIWIILCIVVPIIFFQPVTTIGRLYYQLNKKPVSFVTVALISSFTAILVNYITIVPLRMGYLGFLLGTTAAGFVAFVIYAYLIYFRLKLLPSLRFSWKWLKRNLLITLPTIPHFYAGYLLNISDRVLLDFLKVPVKEIGLYAFAYGIGTYFSILGKSLQLASGPYLMEFYKLENHEGDKKARNISYFMQAGMLLIAFFICLWMKELFQFIARNEELKSSYYLAIPVVMAYTYFPSYNFNGLKMWYLEKTKALMKISVVAAILSVGLNLVLIPLFGILGAAVTTFISFMFMGFGGYLYPGIRNSFKVKYYGGVWLLVIVILSIITFYLKSASISIKVIITLMLFSGLLVLIFNKKKLSNHFSVRNE